MTATKLKNKLHLYPGNLRGSGQLLSPGALFCQLPARFGCRWEAWTLLSIKKLNSEDQLPLHLPRDQSFWAFFLCLPFPERLMEQSSEKKKMDKLLSLHGSPKKQKIVGGCSFFFFNSRLKERKEI